MESRRPFHVEGNREALDARRYPRFRFDAELRIYLREQEVIRAQTVDISESGVAAMLKDEIPLNQLVRLEFSVPFGDVEVHALVCQRNAFRYGFQFIPSNPAQQLIERTCRHLATAQKLRS